MLPDNKNGPARLHAIASSNSAPPAPAAATPPSGGPIELALLALQTAVAQSIQEAIELAKRIEPAIEKVPPGPAVVQDFYHVPEAGDNDSTVLALVRSIHADVAVLGNELRSLHERVQL